MLEQHLEKLPSFHAAATERSLAKAAARLRLTQPAVSKNIRALEDALQAPLFTRHRRGVELTDAGAELLKFCESVFLRVRDLEHRIRGAEAISGVIRVGTYETLGESFWPQALKRLASAHPRLTVELTTQPTVWSLLEAGALDLVVDAEPRTTAEFRSIPLYADQFGIFQRKGAPREWEERPMAFVRRAVDRAGTTISEHMRKLGLRSEPQYDVESFTMARSLAVADACVAVLPLALAATPGLEPVRRNGKAIVFGSHRICVTMRDTPRIEPRIQAVIDVLKAHAAASPSKQPRGTF